MYRILRNNKERGPFNLQELLALSLKPYDLIWIEGKSAGWRYPSEIEALKPYLETQPAESAPQTTSPIQATSQPMHPASQNTRPSTIAEPSVVPMPAITVQEAGTAAPEEEMTAEKLERKAAELYQRVQAFSQHREQQQKGVQTKYARSLEDMKKEYADWLHRKKARKKFHIPTVGAKVWVGTGMICVLAAVFFIRGRHTEPAIEALQESNTTKNYVSGAVFHPGAGIKKQTSSPIYKKPVVSQPESTVPALSSVDEFIDSVEKVLAKSNHHTVSYSKAGATQKREIPFPPVPAMQESEPIQAPHKSEGPISRLVNMNARFEQDLTGHNVSMLEVTIRNNSTELLKSVTVDVFYYKRGDRLFDKETLYFSNIQPGNSLTLSRPGNKKAVMARFQLGQVDADN